MYVPNLRLTHLTGDEKPAGARALLVPVLVYLGVAVLAVAIVVGLDALGYAVQCSVADAPPSC